MTTTQTQPAFKRIKRIRTHTGHAQFIAQCSEDSVGHIARQRDIPSPYAYSPTHVVYQDDAGQNVIIVETAHRCFDVFAVPASEPFVSDE